MGDSSEKLMAKLAALDSSLDDLEDKLEPLLAQTLPESLLPLETIQQVKLNVALPYLVYDLIFIYLKTRGIDPKSHPVAAELNRVRQYFDKIKNAEDPEKRKTAVDKAAANRFIKHAIAQVKDQEQRTPGEVQSDSRSSARPLHTHIRFDENGNAPSPSASLASARGAQIPPGKVTSKMLERAEYQKQLDEGSGSSDEDVDADTLEIIDDKDENAESADGPARLSSKAKGKAKATDAQDVSMADGEVAGAKKRRRPAPDPFAGYGDTPETKSTKSSKKKKAIAQSTPGEDMAVDEPRSETGPSQSAKKDQSAAKKAKRKAKKAS
ncbi:hypothetical protein BD309DRAFT_947740 [Dichomitus squalens]|nr:hypothetical protein BD309DRAFT_947740 [Dichomitus squalens]